MAPWHWKETQNSELSNGSSSKNLEFMILNKKYVPIYYYEYSKVRKLYTKTKEKSDFLIPINYFHYEHY